MEAMMHRSLKVLYLLKYQQRDRLALALGVLVMLVVIILARLGL